MPKSSIPVHACKILKWCSIPNPLCNKYLSPLCFQQIVYFYQHIGSNGQIWQSTIADKERSKHVFGDFGNAVRYILDMVMLLSEMLRRDVLFVASNTWKSAKISSLLILAWVNLWKWIYQPKTRQLKMLGVATMICYHLHSCWDGTCMLQLFLVSDIFNCHCKECLRGRGCAAADQLTFQTRRLPSLNIWNRLSHKHFLLNLRPPWRHLWLCMQHFHFLRWPCSW